MRGPTTACGRLWMVGALLGTLACGDDVPATSASTGTTGEATGTTGETHDTALSVTPEDTTADSGASTTGPSGVCGNGEIEAGEQCDDRNTVDDDSCYGNCTIPFETAWTETLDGGEDDFANDAVFDGEGNLYVLGGTMVAAQGYDVWLRKYQPDGTEAWTWTYDGGNAADDTGASLARHPSGDLVITGTTETADGNDALLLRLSPDTQAEVWSVIHDGSGTDPLVDEDDDFGIAVAVDADGSVVMVVSEGVAGQFSDIVTHKYDADGNEQWTDGFHDVGDGDNDRARDVAIDADGNIYVVGNHQPEPMTIQGWVRRLDAAGTEVWTQSVPEVLLSAIDLDADGNLVIAGYQDGDIWVTKYDPDFGLLGQTTYNGTMGFDLAYDVAVGPQTNHVYPVGSITIIGDLAQTWVARYRANAGLRLWSDTYGNDEAHLDDEVFGIAISDDELRVAAVGVESVIGQDRNIWVRMIENYPAPPK